MADGVAGARTFADVLDDRAVTTVYQPLVHLATRRVVGYEALSRGPAGTPWEDPAALFAAARACGRLAELDWVCRASAFRGALDARLSHGMSLFVNVEPEALGAPCPPDLRSVVARAERTLRVMTEMTERSLTRDPAALLQAVSHARAVGWGVALDEVGRDPASLALMPFVNPDVVRLHGELVRHAPGNADAALAGAVMAQAEATGAVVLAEGIETEEHRKRALALGATLGQGWLFGRPGPIEPGGRLTSVVRLLDVPPAPPEVTPYDLVSRQRGMRTASKSVLVALSRHVEETAAWPAQPPVVLSTFQHARHFNAQAAGRYARLARTSSLVAAIGVDMGPEPVAGVRGSRLHPDDPLAQDWTVLVIGPHFAAGVIARDLGDGGPDLDRRFSFCVIYERELVLQSARALLLRLAPT